VNTDLLQLKKSLFQFKRLIIRETESLLKRKKRN
jgi:hypothetical protein